MDSLPTEIVAKILGEVNDDLKTMLRCQRVCRRWGGVVREVFWTKATCLSLDCSAKTSWSLQVSVSCVHETKEEGVSGSGKVRVDSPHLARLHRQLGPQLHCLHLNDAPRDVTWMLSSARYMSGSKMKRLRSLDISAASVAPFHLRSFVKGARASLERLSVELRDPSAEPHQTLGDVLKACPRLRDLRYTTAHCDLLPSISDLELDSLTLDCGADGPSAALCASLASGCLLPALCRLAIPAHFLSALSPALASNAQFQSLEHLTLLGSGAPRQHSPQLPFERLPKLSQICVAFPSIDLFFKGIPEFSRYAKDRHARGEAKRALTLCLRGRVPAFREIVRLPAPEGALDFHKVAPPPAPHPCAHAARPHRTALLFSAAHADVFCVSG